MTCILGRGPGVDEFEVVFVKASYEVARKPKAKCGQANRARDSEQNFEVVHVPLVGNDSRAL